LSKHTAFAVTLPNEEADGGNTGNTDAVAFQPSSVAKGLDAVIEVLGPVVSNPPPLAKSPVSQVAIEVMFTIPKNAAPLEVLQ